MTAPDAEGASGLRLTEEERATAILRNIPDAFWDVATWRDGSWSPGNLDVADRKRIVLRILAAQLAAHPPEPEASERTDGWCGSCGRKLPELGGSR